MSVWLLLVALFFSPAAASELPSCETPQQAADTLLALLQADRYAPKEAASCLNIPAGTKTKGPELAVQLKSVLDARGYYVKVKDLPGPGEEVPPGTLEYPLVDQLPEVYLEKVDDRWLWSQETVQATPELYKDTFTGIGAWLRNTLPAGAQKPLVGPIQGWQIAFFGVLIGASLLGAILVNLVLRQWLLSFIQNRGLKLNAQVFERTRGPMRALAFGAIFLVGVPEMALPVQASVVLLFVARVCVAIAGVVITMRWTDVFADLFLKRAEETDTRMDDQIVPLVARLTKILVTSLALVFVLSNLGVDVGGLIAGLGIGGIAIAFGAQETVANLFGSVTIFTDRPFQVGDWVKVAGVEGTVEEVGFRSTRIRPASTSVVTLPNSTVASASIDNLGQRTARRASTTLGITYNTPRSLVEAFIGGIRQLLDARPEVLDGHMVEFSGFGASSLDVVVIFNLNVPTYADELRVRGQIFLSIMSLAEALGVSFAFPSQSVYVESTPERPQQPLHPLREDEVAERVRTVLHTDRNLPDPEPTEG
ncbi:MAG: mechanosensitive ion channel family protein [Myxococcota bacterium]|nr:mechanosensitive ion channel family protein [Myxococcota bacterium]